MKKHLIIFLAFVLFCLNTAAVLADPIEVYFNDPYDNPKDRTIQNMILEKFRIFLTVGFYAVATERQEDFEKINDAALKHPGVLGTHGVYFDDEAKTLSFDVLVDFTVRDKAGLCQAIRKELEPLFPGYTIMINLDTNYSD